MGRRTLRPLAAPPDVADYLYEMTELPDDWRPAACFPQSAPLEVEVGTGRGLFLSTASLDHPQRNFLGIEIAGKYAQYSAALLAQQQSRNARMVRGDAGLLLARHLPTASVSAVHVYFPDPWWKRRHRKRRVMNASLAQSIERVLIPGGHLHFWTDVEEYFQSTLALLARTTQLVGPQPVAERPAEHDLDYRTHFERRMRKHNEAIYRSEFLKQEN